MISNIITKENIINILAGFVGLLVIAVSYVRNC